MPTIARWPGKTTPGTTCDVPVHNVDFYATFLAVSGGNIPKGKTLDGEDISPLFESKPIADRGIFWHFPGYLNSDTGGSRNPNFRTPPVTVMRKGNWKLHLFHEEWSLDGGRKKIDTNNCVELYNLKDDIGETKNLANINKVKRDQMLNEMLAWIDHADAKIATEKNPEYNPTKVKTKKKR